MSEYKDALKKICEALDQHPRLWDKETFDAFEVGTCEIIGRESDGSLEIEAHDDPTREVHMYTVYGHYPHDKGEMRGVDALFDFTSEQEAEAMSLKAELEVLTFGGAQ